MIIRGIPSSGKSTLAKELVKSFNQTDYVILSTDDIVSASGVYLWSPEMIKESHFVNQIKCKTAMKQGITYVVIDNTNTTYKEMEPYIKLAKQFDYVIQIFEPTTPWKFDIDECFKRNTHNVPRESLEKMLSRWETTESIIKERLC